MKKKTGSELRKKTFLIVFLFSSLFSRKHLNKVFFKNFLKNIFFLSAPAAENAEVFLDG